MFDGLIHLVGLLGGIALVDHLADGLGHPGRTVGLEDISSHIHAMGAFLDRPVSHLQGLQLGQLLAAGDDDGHRAGGGHPLEPVAVVALDEVGAVLGQHAGGQLEEFFRAFAFNAGITLHVKNVYGRNDHHKIESMFKAVAYALKTAVRKNSDGSVVSTKGTL